MNIKSDEVYQPDVLGVKAYRRKRQQIRKVERIIGYMILTYLALIPLMAGIGAATPLIILLAPLILVAHFIIESTSSVGIHLPYGLDSYDCNGYICLPGTESYLALMAILLILALFLIRDHLWNLIMFFMMPRFAPSDVTATHNLQHQQTNKNIAVECTWCQGRGYIRTSRSPSERLALQLAVFIASFAAGTTMLRFSLMSPNAAYWLILLSASFGVIALFQVLYPLGSLLGWIGPKQDCPRCAKGKKDQLPPPLQRRTHMEYPLSAP